VSIEYEVRSVVGALLFTSPERRLALRFARRNRDLFPGLAVEEVTRSESRRRLYTAMNVARAA
jgi:hypothetical protein